MRPGFNDKSPRRGELDTIFEEDHGEGLSKLKRQITFGTEQPPLSNIREEQIESHSNQNITRSQ